MARNLQAGFTLTEMLASVAIGSMVLGAMTAFMFAAQTSVRESDIQQALYQDANFALDRMVRAVERANLAFVPLAENPSTPHSESVRQVLAVSMDPTLDRDLDGWADANNDRDWMDYDNDGTRDPNEPERVDEDPAHDYNNDGAPGIIGVDDDGDGQRDEPMEFDDPAKSHEDDDEDGYKNDDSYNGYDDDGDGSIDEDIKNEYSDDEAAGLANYDDNFDGVIDNVPGDAAYTGFKKDDDEDGSENEDWPDPVVYYIGATEVYDTSNGATPAGNANTLYERLANAAATHGTDFTSREIIAGVESFEVRRLPPQPGSAAPLFQITLAVSDGAGRSVTVSRTARLRARL